MCTQVSSLLMKLLFGVCIFICFVLTYSVSILDIRTPYPLLPSWTWPIPTDFSCSIFGTCSSVCCFYGFLVLFQVLWTKVSKNFSCPAVTTLTKTDPSFIDYLRGSKNIEWEVYSNVLLAVYLYFTRSGQRRDRMYLQLYNPVGRNLAWESIRISHDYNSYNLLSCVLPVIHLMTEIKIDILFILYFFICHLLHSLGCLSCCSSEVMNE